MAIKTILMSRGAARLLGLERSAYWERYPVKVLPDEAVDVLLREGIPQDQFLVVDFSPTRCVRIASEVKGTFVRKRMCFVGQQVGGASPVFRSRGFLIVDCARMSPRGILRIIERYERGEIGNLPEVDVSKELEEVEAAGESVDMSVTSVIGISIADGERLPESDVIEALGTVMMYNSPFVVGFVKEKSGRKFVFYVTGRIVDIVGEGEQKFVVFTKLEPAKVASIMRYGDPLAFWNTDGREKYIFVSKFYGVRNGTSWVYLPWRYSRQLRTSLRFVPDPAKPVFIKVSNVDNLRVVDISLGGAGFLCEECLWRPGELVPIELRLPFVNVVEIVRGIGRIRYCRKVGERLYKCGVSFEDLSGGGEGKIRTYIFLRQAESLAEFLKL